jgi:proline iminopeptidase
MKFTKHIIPHNEFYLATFTLSQELPYLLFIHGGPAFNAATIEKMVEEHHLFDHLNANIIFYDQRNCGRSPKISSKVTHDDNINDLHTLFNFLTEQNIPVKAFMGHSYGAKLLNDFYLQYPAITVPGIFIAVAESMLTPRLNNLMLDLNYLKMEQPDEYKKVLSQLNDDMSLDSIWKLTEDLAPLFTQNKSRPYFYWANLDWFHTATKIQAEHKYMPNQEVFMSVRKDIHKNKHSISISINRLPIQSLWINGFHDYIMKNILCYGDSNSWGFIPGGYNSKVMLAQRYPHNVRWLTILNKILGSDYHLIEENLNGRNTSFDETPADRPSRNGLATLPGILETHYPIDLIIFMLGTNDARVDRGINVSVEQIVAGMHSLIRYVKNSHFGKDFQAPHILLLAPALIPEPISPYMADSFDASSVKKSNQLAKHYAELAQKENCAFLNIGDLVTVSSIDSVHIDEHGQPIVAKAIAEKILAMKI